MNEPDYQQNVRAWAVQRAIETGLCRLDMATGTFARVH